MADLNEEVFEIESGDPLALFNIANHIDSHAFLKWHIDDCQVDRKGKPPLNYCRIVRRRREAECPRCNDYKKLHEEMYVSNSADLVKNCLICAVVGFVVGLFMAFAIAGAPG